MTEKPTFDAARSAAMKSMLMRAVDQNKPPARAKRVALVVSLCISAVLLATGGAAWAISGKPFFAQAPAPAPTSVAPTPSATPTPTRAPAQPSSPTATPAIPSPTVPVGCDALGDYASIATLAPGSALASSADGIFTPVYAGLAQAGVLHCTWQSSTGRSPLVAVTIATAPAAGQQDVTSQINGGASAVAIGDGGAITCPWDATCTTSATIGAYWLVVDVSADNSPEARELATRASVGFASALAQNPEPSSPWVAPSSPWSGGGDCSALTSDRPMTDVLGAKWITGPYPFKQGSQNPIDYSQSHAFNCFFASAPGITQDPDIITTLTVSVSPGSAWAYHQSSASGDPVAVNGADGAALICMTAEGDYCYLDVLTEGAWMQLGFGDMLSPDRKDTLIAAAEALIAGHRE